MTEHRNMYHPENDAAFVGIIVNKGIEQPDAVDADSVHRFLNYINYTRKPAPG
jgi:hypothetical protein